MAWYVVVARDSAMYACKTTWRSATPCIRARSWTRTLRESSPSTQTGWAHTHKPHNLLQPFHTFQLYLLTYTCSVDYGESMVIITTKIKLKFFWENLLTPKRGFLKNVCTVASSSILTTELIWTKYVFWPTNCIFTIFKITLILAKK